MSTAVERAKRLVKLAADIEAVRHWANCPSYKSGEQEPSSYGPVPLILSAGGSTGYNSIFISEADSLAVLTFLEDRFSQEMVDLGAVAGEPSPAEVEANEWLVKFTAEAQRLNAALDRVSAGENATKVWAEFYGLQRGWLESEHRFWGRLLAAASATARQGE